MNLNQLAQEIYSKSYQDEMQKLAQQAERSPSMIENTISGISQYVGLPEIAALAALPLLANKGSVAGRKAGLRSAPVFDWMMAKKHPGMSLGDYATSVVKTRSVLPHVGTLAGALAGVGGTALLYDLLKDRI